MKKFSDLLEGILESTAFNDPPVMLVLRRKAIRMFPGGESVAQYRNDNLNIDVAIPYRPSTLGQVRKPVATATTEETHPKFSKVKVNKPDDEYHDQEGAVTGHFSKDPSKHFVQFSDVPGNKRVYKGHELTRLESMNLDEIRDLRKDSRDINADLGHRYSHLRVKENQKAIKANSSYAAWTVHGKNEGDKKAKAIATLVHKLNTKFEETNYKLDEVMSPELKRLKKERNMFKRDLARQEDRFDLSKQRLDWAKRALAGHIKKHGKVLKPMAEENINEISAKTATSYIYKTTERHNALDKTKADNDHKVDDYSRKMNNRRKGLRRASEILLKNKKTNEETILESSMRSMWTIAKDRIPRTVRFRDGSTAMVDHPTAAQIMHLHSKVNRQNRHKIQSLVNSGASGIKKISAFIKQHMKIQKGK